MMKLPVIIAPLPNTISNGQTADAIPLMADLNHIVNQVNANAAALGTVALLAAANSFTLTQSGVSATSPANFPIASQVQNWDFNTLSSVSNPSSAGIITARVTAVPLSAYARGQVFSFQGPSINQTGASIQLNIDGVGNASIRNALDIIVDSLDSGMIERGRTHLVRYVTGADLQATGFQLINPSPALVPFTPTITFATPGNLSVTYTTRYGAVISIPRFVVVFFDVLTASFTHTTASGNLQLTGYSSAVSANDDSVGSCVFSGITKATYTQVVPNNNSGTTIFIASGSGVASSAVTAADVPTGGTVRLRGFVFFPANN